MRVWGCWLKAAFLFVLLFLVMQSVMAQPDYKAFPTYPAVVDSFFSRYQVSARPYRTEFEKRTTGWFVSVWYEDSLVADAVLVPCGPKVPAVGPDPSCDSRRRTAFTERI